MTCWCNTKVDGIFRKRRGDKSSKDGKRPVSNEHKEKGKSMDGDKCDQEDQKDAMKEADILLLQR